MAKNKAILTEDQGNHPAATAELPLALRPAITTTTTDITPEIHKLWADTLAAAYTYILSPEWGNKAIEHHTNKSNTSNSQEKE